MNKLKFTLGLVWYILKDTNKPLSRLLWGTISFSISVAIATYSVFLSVYVYNLPEITSTIPFYVFLIAVPFFFVGFVLMSQGWIKMTYKES